MTRLHDGRKAPISFALVALMIFSVFTGLTFGAENALAGHGVSITSPSQGQDLGNGAVQVSFTVSSGDQLVSPSCSLEYKTSDSGSFQQAQTDSQSCGSSGGSFSWPASTIQSKDVTLRVTVTDVTGTDSQSNSVSDLTIDNVAPSLDAIQAWSTTDSANTVNPRPANVAPSIRVGQVVIQATVNDGNDGTLQHVSQGSTGAGVTGKFELKGPLNKQNSFTEQNARNACSTLTAAAQGLTPESPSRFKTNATTAESDGRLVCFTLSWKDSAGNTGQSSAGFALVLDGNPRIQAGTPSLSTPAFTVEESGLLAAASASPVVGAGPYTITFDAYDHKWGSSPSPRVGVEVVASGGGCSSPSFRAASTTDSGQVKTVSLSIPDSDAIFSGTQKGILCLTPAIQDAGGKSLRDATGAPVPTWTVQFDRTRPTFTLGSEAVQANRFAVKENEAVTIRSASTNTFQDNVVLVVDPKPGPSASLSKVQVESASWDATNKRCGSFSLIPNGEKGFNGNTFPDITWNPSKGVHCIRVSVTDSAGGKATLPPAGQPKRVAVDEEESNHKPSLSAIKADEPKGQLIFKQGGDSTTIGAPLPSDELQLGGKVKSFSAAFIRYTFSSGVVVEEEIPADGLWTDPETGTTYDFWTGTTATDVFFPPIELCEDRNDPNECDVPQGEYGNVRVQIVDAFNRISSQETWTTRADPGSNDWGHLIVDNQAPTGTLEQPSPNPETGTISVIADKLFTTRVKAGDTSIGAYDADPSEDISVTLEVRDSQLSTALPFEVEGQTGQVNQINLRYTGDRPAASGSQQPFEKRIKIPVSVASTNPEVVLVAYPIDPAGNTPLRPQNAIKSSTILVGSLNPQLNLRPSDNPQVPKENVTKGSTNLTSPLPCGASTCSYTYANGTRPSGGTYPAYVLNFQIKNDGNIPDTVKVFAERVSGQQWPASIQLSGGTATPQTTTKTETRNVTLDRDQTTTVTLTVSLPDSARATQGQDFSNWVLEIRSERDTSKAQRATIEHKLLPNVQFDSFLVEGTTERLQRNLTMSPTDERNLKLRIHNEGNTRGDYAIGVADHPDSTPPSGASPPLCGDSLNTGDNRDQIVLRTLSSGQRITSIAVDPGQTVDLDLNIRVERFAFPTEPQFYKCQLTIDPEQAGTDAQNRIVAVKVLRDPRLNMEEFASQPSPDEDLREINRTDRPGTSAEIQVKLSNKANGNLPLKIDLKPTVQDWTWENQVQVQKITLDSRNSQTPTPIPACRPTGTSDDECILTIKLRIPNSAVAGEERSFSIIARDDTSNVVLDSLPLNIEVGNPGTVSFDEPSTQALPAGSTPIALALSVSSDVPFTGAVQATLEGPKNLGCSGSIDLTVVGSSSSGATLSQDIVATAPTASSGWKVVEDGKTTGISCTALTGPQEILYLRPVVTTTTKNVVITGVKPLALALGYTQAPSGAESTATLQEPADQRYRAGSGEGIILDVTPGSMNEHGFLVYQGLSTTGFEDIGCFGEDAGANTEWTPCPTVTSYRSYDILADQVPVDGTLRTPQKTTETDDERRTQTASLPDGFVTELRLSQPDLKLGWNPVVFRVSDAGSPRTFATFDSTATVDVAVYTSEGWTRQLPTADARSLGDGWFEVDLFIPPMAGGNVEVTRLDLDINVNGQSTAGRQISGEAVVNFGTRTTPVTLPNDVFVRTERTGSGSSETVTKTWYLDVSAPFGEITRSDWEIGQQRQTGTQEPTYSAGGRAPSSTVPGAVKDGGSWGLFKNTTSEGPAYYLCRGCTNGQPMPTDGSDPFQDQVPVFRLTPFENDQGSTTVSETQTWTGVDTTGSTMSRDAGVQLSSSGLSLEQVTMGAQGVKLYIEDGQDTVRLTQISNPSIQAATYVEAAPGERFENPPEIPDVISTVAVTRTSALTFGGTAAQMMEDDVFTGFVDGKFTVFNVVSPGPRTGPGLQEIRMGIMQVSLSTGDQPTFTANYQPFSGDIVVTPHAAPNRPAKVTGNERLTLAQEDGSPWFTSRARLTAAGAEERLWHLEVRATQSGGTQSTVHYEVIVDAAMGQPQGTTKLPAFLPLDEGQTGLNSGQRLDHRAIPGFDLQFGNVTLDLVAVNGADQLQRRSEQFEIDIIDAAPPELNVTAPTSVEVGQTVPIEIRATDPSGVESVTATIAIGSGSATDIPLQKKSGDIWNGTFVPQTAGSATLTVTASDGANVATETLDIEIGANQKPRIANGGVVVDGTQFIRPGGSATFEVTDASIADGEITARLGGGTGGTTVEGPTVVSGDEGNITVTGLGTELEPDTYTATVTLLNTSLDDDAPVEGATVWLNVTDPDDAETAAIDGEVTDASGEVSGDVDLSATGTYTVTIEAQNETDTWTHTFDIEVLEATSGTSGQALTIGSRTCAQSKCTIQVDPGLDSDGDTHAVIINATDATGRSAEKSFTVKADGTGPSLTVEAKSPSVSGAPTVVGPDTPISATASDDGAGVDGSITLTAIQGGVEVGSATVQTGSSVLVSQLGVADAGTFRVEGTVRDKLNNSASSTVNFMMDDEGPSVGDVSFARVSDGLRARTTVEDDAGVGTVRLSYRVGATGSFQPIVLQANDGGTYQGVIQGLPSTGTLQYFLRVSDGVGNEATKGSQASPLSFDIGSADVAENTPPSVSISSPGSGDRVSGTIQVTWTTSDADGDVVTVQAVRMAPQAGGQTLDLTLDDGSATVDTTQLPEGAAVITVEASDGTDTGTGQVQVIVDNQPDAGACTAGETLRAGNNVPICFRLNQQQGLASVKVSLIRNGETLSTKTLDPVPSGIYQTTFDIPEEGTYALQITKTNQDGTTEETTSEPFQVQSALSADSPVGRFIAALVLGVLVIGMAAFAAFGRWN